MVLNPAHAVDADPVVSPTATTITIPQTPTPPHARRRPATVRVPGAEYLALILPSDEGELTASAMENWYQACSTDEPFALEITGTSREQGFVLRASSQAQFDLLCKQLEAQYPQCDILRIHPLADPLRPQPGEVVMIGEFGLLQDSWLPIKVFSGKALSEPGTDPLPNILAAMESIGSGCRIVTQIALVRAPESWLNADVRKTVEHPLQYERDAQVQIAKGTVIRNDTEHAGRLIGIIALIFGGFFLYTTYRAHAPFLIGLLVVLAVLGFIGYLWWQVSQRAHPIYDMKLVAEKMSKAAFYAQLRVMVIGQEPTIPLSKEDLEDIAFLNQQRKKASLLQGDIRNLQEELRLLIREQHDRQKLSAQQPSAPFLSPLDQQLFLVQERLRQTQEDLRSLLSGIKRLQQKKERRAQERKTLQLTLRQKQKQAFLQKITDLETAYRQFTQSSANGFVLKRTRFFRASEHAPQSFYDLIQLHRFHAAKKAAEHLSDVRYAFPYSQGWQRLLHHGAASKWVLNSLELSGMFHLPQQGADLPLIRRTSVKRLLFPPEIAQKIRENPVPLPPALVGISKHRRYRVPVLLPFDALFSHKAAFGMSRSGKTVLMLLLSWAAMQPVKGNTTPQPGIFAIDPHRDFVMDLLKLIAPYPELAKRLVLLDMTDTTYPVALNPLDASMGFTRDQAVSNAMSSFKEIWRDFWGPRMAYFLNAICLLLYTLNQDLVRQGKAHEQYTLLDINPLLQYKDYALKVLTKLNMKETWHQELLAWWKNTYFTLPVNSSFRQEVIMPILSKIGVFNDNAQLRNIVGQPVTKAPVHLAITEGKIVLCALSSKDMSEEAVNILGSTLVNLLHSAFTLQQQLPLTRRRKVFCALDEFHAFTGSQLDRMLSEDAKLGCSMLLSTQNLKRLNKIREGLMEMVFSNCQQLFAFRVSAADARILEEELQERVTVKHIISQPALHCYARLAFADYPIQIVSAQLAKPGSWGDDPARAQQAEDLLHEAQILNLPADEVERRYGEHLKQFLNIQSYAEKIERDVRGAEENKKKIEDTAKLAEEQDDLRQVQGRARTTQPGGQPSGMPSSPDTFKSTQPKAGARNHRRSKKMGKKDAVGAPPPVVEEQDITGKEDAIVDALARFMIPSGMSRASFGERERGE